MNKYKVKAKYLLDVDYGCIEEVEREIIIFAKYKYQAIRDMKKVIMRNPTARKIEITAKKLK